MTQHISILKPLNRSIFGAWVICEPWFTGSRDFCELCKYVNHNFFLILHVNQTFVNHIFVNHIYVNQKRKF
jgi:hypothetical protein